MGTALPAAVAGCTRYLQPVCSPHANRCKEKPQNEPEEIKRQTQGDGINTVPQGNRKAGSNERNEPEENCSERWRFHAESPATDPRDCSRIPLSLYQNQTGDFSGTQRCGLR